MKAILELRSNLNKIIVRKLKLLSTIKARSNINCSISDTEAIDSTLV